jgi:AcrR family transcriptional regulator
LPTNSELSEATRAALLRAGRAVFTERGYNDAAIEEIVRRAGITRGALYYHFTSKRDLFRAVYEEVDLEFAGRVIAAAEAAPPEEQLETGCRAFLDACVDPAIQRIVLLDALPVLGWDAWHAIDINYGLGLTIRGLRVAMDAGRIERQPSGPLAQLLLGALVQAGLAIARAEDVDARRAQMTEAIARLLAGLRPR